MIDELGFIRVGAIVPKIKIANPEFNSNEIVEQIKKAAKQNVDIVAVPECAITGKTCEDLLKQDILLKSAMENLEKIISETKDINIISIIGMPLEFENKILSVAVVVQKGEALAVITEELIFFLSISCELMCSFCVFR